MSVFPCKSVPTDLGVFPDYWRVNYAFGMVLGVDDFRQEQAYHVGRKRLNNRALHGHGVAYGLDVVVEPVVSDLQVRVMPGMAVMPGGEDVEVTEEHCLRLNEWLAARAADEDEPIVESPPGRLRICVTLRYAECLERKVPVPGLPCSTDEETGEYSRIRESFELRLDTLPPDQAAEWASRRLGDILCRVQIDDSRSPPSDLAQILCLVRDIPSWVEGTLGISSPPIATHHESPPCAALPHVLTLPKDASRAALQEIYRVWASEVRPQLAAYREDPRAEEDRIVLACLDVGISDGSPRVVDQAGYSVDPSTRPVLVNTRAIQELFFAGSRRERAPVRFATLHADEPNRLLVWLHHPSSLDVPAGAMEVTVDDGPPVGFTAPSGAGNLIELTLNDDLVDDARVRVSFDIGQILSVGSGAGGENQPLAESMRDLGVEYVSRAGDHLHAETIFSGLTATRRFVTVHTSTSAS